MKARQLQSLRRIVAVREAQEEGAKLEARRASQALADAEARQDEEAGRQDQREAAWAGEMAAPSLRFEAARAWAHALEVGADRLETLAEERAQADQARLARFSAWRAAHGRAEVARSLSRDGARRFRRRAEEAQLGELTDRLSRRWDRHED